MLLEAPGLFTGSIELEDLKGMGERGWGMERKIHFLVLTHFSCRTLPSLGILIIIIFSSQRKGQPGLCHRTCRSSSLETLRLHPYFAVTL